MPLPEHAAEAARRQLALGHAHGSSFHRIGTFFQCHFRRSLIHDKAHHPRTRPPHPAGATPRRTPAVQACTTFHRAHALRRRDGRVCPIGRGPGPVGRAALRRHAAHRAEPGNRRDHLWLHRAVALDPPAPDARTRNHRQRAVARNRRRLRAGRHSAGRGASGPDRPVSPARCWSTDWAAGSTSAANWARARATD